MLFHLKAVPASSIDLGCPPEWFEYHSSFADVSFGRLGVLLVHPRYHLWPMEGREQQESKFSDIPLHAPLIPERFEYCSQPADAPFALIAALIRELHHSQWQVKGKR